MSEKDYGCFYCEGKTSDPDAACPGCGEKINISEKLIGLELKGEFLIKEILGRGFHGWTVLAEDKNLFHSVAIKVIPKHRSKNDVLKEPRALVQCKSHSNLASFIRTFETKVFDDLDVSCLVFENIPNAQPLYRLLNDSSIILTRTDVIDILRGISKGLERMHGVGLWHDDLHNDNILIRDIQADEESRGRFESKLIDFGSTKTNEAIVDKQGEGSDYSYLSKHIYELVSKFEFGNQKTLTPSDRTFSKILRRLAHRLEDKNVSRRSISPKDVSQELTGAQDECSSGHKHPSFEEMTKHLGVKLNEPLENTNALYLEPQDIALLFCDALDWEPRLHRSEPVMVVGPRGCGKTMLLRYLSVNSSARPRLNETKEDVKTRLLDMKYIGFLINVGQLRTPFIRSAYKELENQAPNLAEEFSREFLNLNFVYEVVSTLIWLDTEKILPLSPDDVSLVVALLVSLSSMDIEAKHETLHSFAESLDRRIMSLSNLKLPSDYNPTAYARDDILHKLGGALRTTSWGSQKEIWFLLDDYSVTVLPELAQKAYNPVLYYPTTELRIKLSSEGDGPNVTDTLDRKYREGREVSKVNLGEVYFQSSEKDSRKFFEAILEARFRETKKGSLTDLQTLLGEHSNQSNFGVYINSLIRPGDARFYGFGLICQLCSGDVSFILELLHTLTQGQWGKISSQIPESEQDLLIKRFAQRQLSELRNIADYGMQLHTFADSMGALIKLYLTESKNKPKADERLRIEIEGVGNLSTEAQKVHEALLRYSVLISGGAGKSQAGLPTKKLFFRRMFSPCYPFSPSRSGCIAITIAEYESWLLNPALISRHKVEKTTDTRRSLNFEKPS